MDKLKELKSVIEIINTDRASTKEVALAIKAVIEAIRKAREDMKSELASSSNDIKGEIKILDGSLKSTERSLKLLIAQTDKQSTDDFYKLLNREVYKLEEQINNIEIYDDSKLETKWAAVVDDLHQKIKDIKPFILNAVDVRNALESLIGDERLDIDSIKGWDKVIKDLKSSNKGITVMGSRGIQLSVDNANKGTTNYVNLVAGSGITLTPTTFGESTNVTVSSSIGGAPETPSGTVDGSNVTFTFVSSPKVIIVDQGRTLILNSGFTLDVTGLIATLDVAPTFSIFSI